MAGTIFAPPRIGTMLLWAICFCPVARGVGSIYSREHFQAVKDHLTSGGVFCQWFPLYQLGEKEFMIVAATFLDVFPNATVWRNDFNASLPKAALIGIKEPVPSVASIEKRIRGFSESGLTDLWVTDPRRFWMFYVGPLAAAHDDLAFVQRNTDNEPIFEFYSGRITSSDCDELVFSKWPAFADKLWVSRSNDPVFPDRPSGTRGGAVLAHANLIALSQNRLELQRIIEEIRSLVPEDILSVRDPTVSMVWP